MKDLRTFRYLSAETYSSENAVSHMLMGFIERKISPQTIADVLRAQIFESQISVQHIDIVVLNKILESITLANSSEDCLDVLLYLAHHSDFAKGLTFKAAAGALCILLRYLQSSNEVDISPSSPLSSMKLEKQPPCVIEELSLSILNYMHNEPSTVDYVCREFLMSVIQSTPDLWKKMLADSVHFQHLSLLLTQTETLPDVLVRRSFPKPYEMISFLLKIPEGQMLKNGVSYYRTEYSEKNSSGRLKYLQILGESLKASYVSDAKKIFLVEWLFENSLLEAVLNENTTLDYVAALKFIAENSLQNFSFIKGLIQSIQNDFLKIDQLCKDSVEGENCSLLQKAKNISFSLFHFLVPLAEKDLNFFTKNIAKWVIELPIKHDSFRFMNKEDVRWIKTISTKIWDENLREPLPWVIEAGSQYCAIIFYCAPALWLQDYSHFLLEKVCSETKNSAFQPTMEHFNYVEYLLRCIRKKSPFFASRTESLFALYILSRLTRNEAMQFANAKVRFQNTVLNCSPAQLDASSELSLWRQALQNEAALKLSLGNNPVTQSMTILLKLSQETGKNLIESPY